MAQFILLLLSGNELYEEFSEEEIREAIQAYSQWTVDSRRAGKLMTTFRLRLTVRR